MTKCSLKGVNQHVGVHMIRKDAIERVIPEPMSWKSLYKVSPVIADRSEFCKLS